MFAFRVALGSRYRVENRFATTWSFSDSHLLRKITNACFYSNQLLAFHSCTLFGQVQCVACCSSSLCPFSLFMQGLKRLNRTSDACAPYVSKKLHSTSSNTADSPRPPSDLISLTKYHSHRWCHKMNALSRACLESAEYTVSICQWRPWAQLGRHERENFPLDFMIRRDNVDEKGILSYKISIGTGSPHVQ